MTARRVTMWALGVIIVALYVYLVIAAVGNLIGLTQMAGVMELALTGTGVFWLVFGVALPIVALAAVLLLGRGRSAGLRVLLLAAGIAAVAAWQLEIMHLVPQSTFFV